ncbi:MAG: hypothetical protein N3F04_01095 [Candidatus Nezhaarchaeota archaeon]|nr:hypothetical protein [Candidatus Nezhaarchaeota archaeon]MCX8141373.1 hypothetical protein [Candidatus Nezhaarchaeota archaeon]MDW8049639.1 hypothetical protein [Nitrososphaerota archaeon]
MSKVVERLLALIPLVDLIYIYSSRITRIYPELSYLSRRRLLLGWLEHVLYAVLGFMLCKLFGPLLAIMVYVISLSIALPIEVYISRLARIPTWEWAKGKKLRERFQLFCLASLNATLYFLIGLTTHMALLGS